MKAHIGADAASGLVYTMVTTLANAHDVTQAHALLHGEEQGAMVTQGIRALRNEKRTREKR